MEQRDRAVRIFVHPQLRLHEVTPMLRRRDLQNAARIAQRIVVIDDTLLLNAQNVLERASEGDEGRSFPGRRDLEAGVVPRHVDLFKPTIGRRDVRADAGLPQ